MSHLSPVKSPMHKKSKGEDGVSDVEDGATNDGSGSQTLTLEAIGNLLDTKLEPMNHTLTRLSADLGEFKAKVREEFNIMGMKIQSIDTRTTANHVKLAELEQEVSNMKLGSSTSPTSTNAQSNTTVVIGNVPDSRGHKF